MPAPRSYDTRCREVRDLGRAYYVPCEVRDAWGVHTHIGRAGVGDLHRVTWDTTPQCPELDSQGWRCQLAKGHGTYHQAVSWGGDVHNFGTPAKDYVARLANDNLAALASNTIVGPCMDSRMLSPGYAIQCVLSKDHGHPHMVRFGSIVHTWGYETQCPAIDPVHKLRCLKGNGHTELHFSVNSINGEALYWAGAALPDDPEYLAVLKQRGLEQSARPRTYAERKARRR